MSSKLSYPSQIWKFVGESWRQTNLKEYNGGSEGWWNSRHNGTVRYVHMIIVLMTLFRLIFNCCAFWRTIFYPILLKRKFSMNFELLNDKCRHGRLVTNNCSIEWYSDGGFGVGGYNVTVPTLYYTRLYSQSRHRSRSRSRIRSHSLFCSLSCSLSHSHSHTETHPSAQGMNMISRSQISVNAEDSNYFHDLIQ